MGFDDPAALWRTLHLTVDVTQVIPGPAMPGDRIRVGTLSLPFGDAALLDGGTTVDVLRG